MISKKNAQDEMFKMFPQQRATVGWREGARLYKAVNR